MANDRLRDALMAARLTPSDLADRLKINPKTAERWVTQARAPYPKYRHQIAALVGRSEAYLWPDALSVQRRAEVTESEIVHIYPYRADIPAELWTKLFENATENVSILVYSGFFLPEQYAPQLALLRAKADDGACIRILIGDPDCPQVALRGEEEDIGDAIASKIRNVLITPASTSACTARRCTTRFFGSTTRCSSTLTRTVCQRSSRQPCTCGD